MKVGRRPVPSDSRCVICGGGGTGAADGDDVAAATAAAHRQPSTTCEKSDNARPRIAPEASIIAAPL